MKRSIALVLVLMLMFGLCGCKDGKKSSGNGIDIEYYAKLGQIPENDITLGTSPEDLKTALDKRAAEAEKKDEDYGYNEIEGDQNVLIEEGPYDYYYKKTDAKAGIGYIVSYVDAFGFEVGDIISEVEKNLSDYEITKENANEINAFFYFGDYSKAQIISIKFDKNSVMFLFEDNALCATAIMSNDF